MMRRNLVLFYATWNEAGEASACGGRWGKAGKKWVWVLGCGGGRVWEREREKRRERRGGVKSIYMRGEKML